MVAERRRVLGKQTEEEFGNINSYQWRRNAGGRKKKGDWKGKKAERLSLGKQ